MRNSFRAIWLAPALLVLRAVVVQASPIAYTFSGTGPGTLGATSFTNAAFVLAMKPQNVNVRYPLL
jgi:hypothetical protein